MFLILLTYEYENIKGVYEYFTFSIGSITNIGNLSFSDNTKLPCELGKTLTSSKNIFSVIFAEMILIQFN